MSLVLWNHTSGTQVPKKKISPVGNTVKVTYGLVGICTSLRFDNGGVLAETNAVRAAVLALMLDSQTSYF
jgi:hypothetical protein